MYMSLAHGSYLDAVEGASPMKLTVMSGKLCLLAENILPHDGGKFSTVASTIKMSGHDTTYPLG
jgi:hypothetical protein